MNPTRKEGLSGKRGSVTEGWRERGRGPPEAQTVAPGTTPQATPGGLRNSWSSQRAGTIRGPRTEEQPRPTRARHSAAERDEALTRARHGGASTTLCSVREARLKGQGLCSPTTQADLDRKQISGGLGLWGEGTGARTGSPFGLTEQAWDQTVGTAVFPPRRAVSVLTTALHAV